MSYEKFVEQQRSLNPNITEAELQDLWSKQPLSKRIASGVESAITAPVRAVKSLSSMLSSKAEPVKPAAPTAEAEPAPASEQSAPDIAAQSAQDIAKTEEKETPPTTDEAKKSAERQITLLNKLSKLQYASPRDEEAIQRERDRAEELYDKARSRNEWLEVAQTLAAAIAQFGAAQAGAAQGVAVRTPSIAMTDYGARTARSERALERSLRNIEQDAAARERAAKEKTGTEEFNIRMQLEQEKIRQREAEKQAEAGKETAEDRQIRSLQAGDLRSQIQQKQKEVEAASQLANQLAMQSDFSSKSLKKMEEKTPGLLAKAGVDATDLALIEQEATERGYIWDSVNQEKKQQLIKERILDKKREQLSNLRQAFDSVIGSRQAAPARATVQPAAAPSGPRPGDVVDGYRFKGGNPADKNNWEPVTGK